MNKTPRTEKAVTEYHRRDWGKFLGGRTYPLVVHAEFARELELEIKNLKNKIKQLRKEIANSSK